MEFLHVLWTISVTNPSCLWTATALSHDFFIYSEQVSTVSLLFDIVSIGVVGNDYHTFLQLVCYNCCELSCE